MASLPSTRRFSACWWPIGVAVAFLLLQVLLAPAAVFYPDSARYAQLAQEMRGVPAGEAERVAVGMYCADRAELADRGQAARPVPDLAAVAWVGPDCLAGQQDHLLPTGSPRYQELFSTRPAYPAAVAALAPLFGLKWALWVIPILSTLLAGVGVWWLLRQSGLTAGLAGVGQALLYLSPVGWWGTQMLTEGPVLLGVVAAVVGAAMALRGRTAAGGTILAAAFLELAAVKFSTALLLAATLAVAGLGAWLVRGFPRGVGTVVGVTAAAGAILMAASEWWGMPGLRDSVQDMLTDHFARPDVANPWRGLAAANAHYWPAWLSLAPSNVGLIVGVFAGGWALWRWSRSLALLVGAAASVGVVLTVLHPEPFEIDRLYTLAWLVPVFGLPFLAHLLVKGRAPVADLV